MITISVRAKSIVCNFRGTDSFTEIVDVLKKNHCKFNPTQKDWTIPLFKYDKVIGDLQDFDIVEISQFDEDALEALRNGLSLIHI